MEPLAYRMRPQTPDEIVGQKHLIAPGKVLRRCVEAKRLFSIIFYGPPGTGKTTMATVLAQSVGLPYRMFNAVSGNKKDLDRLFEEAKLYPGLVVIIDEVHRLNKDKQDLLLPYVEKGMITISAQRLPILIMRSIRQSALAAISLNFTRSALRIV